MAVTAATEAKRKRDSICEDLHNFSELYDACHLLLLKSRGHIQGFKDGIMGMYAEDARALARYVADAMGAISLDTYREIESRESLLEDENGGGTFSPEEASAALTWFILNGKSRLGKKSEDIGITIFDDDFKEGIELYERTFGRVLTYQLRKIDRLLGRGEDPMPDYKVLRKPTRDNYEAACAAWKVALSHRGMTEALYGDDAVLVFDMDLEEALWRLSGDAVDKRDVDDADKNEAYYLSCLREMDALSKVWDRCAASKSSKMKVVHVDGKQQHYFEDIFLGDPDFVNACAYVMNIDLVMEGVMGGLSVDDVAVTM